MPFETGTASDHIDLWNRLRTFLTTNAALVSAGRQWTQLRLDGVLREATLQGPGLAGTDQVHVATRVLADAGSDVFTIGFQMSRAYNAAQGHLLQPDASGERYLPVWNAPMPYWFIGNGARFIVVVKVSTTYQSCYVGKFLPYGSPSQYPQPYYLGCVSSSQSRWSTTSEDFRAFFNPGSGAMVLTPGGIWATVSNYLETGAAGGSPRDGGNQVWPYNSQIDSNTSPRGRWGSQRDNLGGGYTLLPMILHGANPTREIYGELDGAFAISGFGNASENTLTIGGDPFIVIQDTYRTSRTDYCAIRTT